MLTRLSTISLLAMGTAALADVPNVTTDIAPVHGLVSRVMDGVGAPDLLLPPGASPHHFALRPSQARSLTNADLVVFIGAGLTPWLEDSALDLAEDAAQLELMDAPGTLILEWRSFDDHEDHDDDETHDDHEHEAHDDHDMHDDHEEHSEHGEHEGHADHEEHAEMGHEDHDVHHDHDHGPIDMHGWTDPENAIIWLGLIADALADIDPDNAETYRENAAAGAAEIAEAAEHVGHALEEVADVPFLVEHDALAYFEQRFGLSNHGAVTLADDAAASAGTMAALREEIANHHITCLVVEPQTNPALFTTLDPEGGLVTVVLDPLGMNLEQGPDYYLELLEQLEETYLTCLGGSAGHDHEH